MTDYQSDRYDVCAVMDQARDLTATLNTLVRTITDLMHVKACSIRLLDEKTETLRMAASHGLSAGYLDKGPIRVTADSVETEILEGKVVSTLDVTREEGALFRDETVREGIRSILNVPLMSGERAIGIVRVYTSEPHQFTAEETERLASLSALGGIVIDRARLSDQMRALVCIARSINSTLSLSDVLQMITESARGALSMKAASIRLVDEYRTNLEVRAASGLSEAYLAKGPVEIEKSPLDRECLAGKCMMIPDIVRDNRLQYPEEIQKEGIGGMVTVPLTVKGRAIGVLRVYSPAPYEFHDAEIEFLTALASFGAIAIENARLYEHVKSEYEELTNDVWKWYDWGSRFPNI